MVVELDTPAPDIGRRPLEACAHRRDARSCSPAPTARYRDALRARGGRLMADFLAVTFDGADDAAAALRNVRSIQGADRIGLEDTAVVRKDADGKVTIQNEASIGAILGGLVLVVFPVAGIIGGAVAGGLIGRSIAPGIDGKFVKEVGDDLKPGGSALFLQIKRGGDTGLLVRAMGDFKGRVRQTSLPDEVETALDESLR
jgi:uncharacterized membrane protein